MNIQNNLEFSSKNKKIKTSTRVWYSSEISQMQSPIFVSLATNDVKTNKLPKCLFSRQETLDKYVYHFDAKINRAVLGRNFVKNRFEKRRVTGLGQIEKLRLNPHIHLVLDFKTHMDVELSFCEFHRQFSPDWNLIQRTAKFQELSNIPKMIDFHWKEICPNGTTNVQPVYDINGITKYITKEIYSNNINFVSLPAKSLAG